MSKPLLKRRNVTPATKCVKCGVPRTPEYFSKDKQRKDGLARYCKSCRSKEYHENKHRWYSTSDTERNRIYWLDRKYWTKYRIRYADALKMLEEQKGICAICPSTIGFKIKKSGISVDHDHETGKVRGLLCFNCNAGLGQFRDNLNSLQSAIEYLKKHGK